MKTTLYHCLCSQSHVRMDIPDFLHSTQPCLSAAAVLKWLFTLTCWACIGLAVQAQPENNHVFDQLVGRMDRLERRGDTLKNQLSQLEEENLSLEFKLLSMYRSSIREMEMKVKEAFDKTDVISLSATYQEVIKSIINLHNEITRINNFTDAEKIFGIDFVAIISEIVEKELLVILSEKQPVESTGLQAQKRQRFKAVVQVLLQNPVVTGLFRSNPVSSVAHSIINQVLSMQSTGLESIRLSHGTYELPEDYKDFRNDYGAFKKSYENTQLAHLPGVESQLPDPAVCRFTEALTPYIRLFDELSGINARYSSSLEVFMKASEQTISRVQTVESVFYAKLEATDRARAREVINRFFNIGEEPGLELMEARLNDPKMKEVLEFSDEVNESLLLLKNDFLKIITLEIELTGAYIDFFTSLKTGRDGLPEFRQEAIIDQKIIQFDQLLSSLTKQKLRLEAIGSGD